MFTRKAIALIVVALLLTAATAPLAFSPYGRSPGFAYALLKESTEIAAPCRDVFEYLGNSANASDWSVFVDHITPLNADVVPDGALGSIRRSFRNANEAGMRWDEYFTIVEENRRRQLKIYNVVGAPLKTTGELRTEQLYDVLDENRCRLSFTVFFNGDPGLGDELRMRFGAYPIASIFRGNIENVRRLVEAR